MRVSATLASLLALVLAGSAAAEKPTWFDLITEDAAVARAFYGKLFGWKFRKISPTYSVARLDGRQVAGIAEVRGRLPDAPEDFWLLGVEVGDVDATVEAARKQGGRVHREPETAPGFGRYAVIVDPQGAPLSLWAPEGGSRARPRAADDWVWTELWTDEPRAAVAFYRAVLGYEHRGIDVEGETYHLFTLGDELRAGILRLPFEGVEPNWVPYILVANLPSFLERAVELGGRVLLAPQDKLGRGEVALVADPLGAAFFAHQSRNDSGDGGEGS
jgi:predicted enzyme related to lactoylglutathione lyase